MISFRRHPILPYLLAVLVGACGEPDASGERPEPDAVVMPAGVGAAVDFPAPSLSDTTLAGSPLHLDSLRGSAVLVNFWATWCGPCLREIPDLAAMHRDLRDRSFEIVGVAYNDPDTAAVRAMVRQLAVPYPNVIDGRGDWAEAFGGVYVMPSSFLVDPDGRVTVRFSGLVPPDSLRARLEPLLAGHP